MSVFSTIQDAIAIVNAIRDQVDKYHSNNAICQVVLFIDPFLLNLQEYKYLRSSQEYPLNLVSI